MKSICCNAPVDIHVTLNIVRCRRCGKDTPLDLEVKHETRTHRYWI